MDGNTVIENCCVGTVHLNELPIDYEAFQNQFPPPRQLPIPHVFLLRVLLVALGKHFIILQCRV